MCAEQSTLPARIQLPAGREIVDSLPQEFIVDDQDGINDPVGMIGARLAVKVHIVTSPVTASPKCHKRRKSGRIIVADMVLEQLAAAEAFATEDDKEFGSALVDVGAEKRPDWSFTSGARFSIRQYFHSAARTSPTILPSGCERRFRTPKRSSARSVARPARSLSEMERGELVDVPSVGGRAPRQLSRQILSTFCSHARKKF